MHLSKKVLFQWILLPHDISGHLWGCQWCWTATPSYLTQQSQPQTWHQCCQWEYISAALWNNKQPRDINTPHSHIMLRNTAVDMNNTRYNMKQQCCWGFGSFGTGWYCKVSITWRLISSSGVGRGEGDKKKSISSTLPACNLGPLYPLQSQFSLLSMFGILTFRYHPLQYCCFNILWLVQTKCKETTQLASQIPPPSCYSTDDSQQSQAVFH